MFTVNYFENGLHCFEDYKNLEECYQFIEKRKFKEGEYSICQNRLNPIEKVVENVSLRISRYKQKNVKIVGENKHD